MLDLNTGQIHLWCAFFADINDEALLTRYRSVLNEAERTQEKRFRFVRDQRRYLVTRALVRTVLTRYAAIAPSDWVFTTNAYGRPQIANDAVAAKELSFNLSHTKSLIVLAVANGRAIGVDTENVRARQVSIDIADRYFAPPEVEALRALPDTEQQQRFFEYWTLKESYIKARGMGLSIPLDKFSFHYPHERTVKLQVDSDLSDPIPRWQFWQFRPTEEYLVAVCAERREDTVLEMHVRKVVPLAEEEEKSLVPVFLRTSA